MRKSIPTAILALALLMVLSSCGSGESDEAALDVNPATGGDTPTPGNEEATVGGPTDETGVPDEDGIEAEDPPMTDTSESTPTAEGSVEPIPTTAQPDPTVDAAIEDLVGLAGADPAAVSVLLVEAVTWRDGSIGCPQPGISYTQALVPGTRIILEYEGREYSYHAGRNGAPFYCAVPVEPSGGDSPPAIDQ